MKTLAFAFTRLSVSNLEISERFYLDVFGLQIVRRVSAKHEVYELEEVILALEQGHQSTTLVLTHFLDGRPVSAGGAWTGFLVDDIEKTAAQIAAAGGTIVVPVHHSSADNVIAMHASDPDGHMIAVIQVL